MLPTLLATVALHNYDATPQAAAIQAVSFGLKRPAIIRRMNVVGRYAVVLTSGGMMEGSTVSAPVLVQHFSFGWQALDLLNFRCRLESHELGRQIDALLMRGMPRPEDEWPCRARPNDAGPTADVEAVRRLMHGPLVPYVAASGNWAMGEWYGGGGGESLYRKHEDHWQVVADGGGAMGVQEMRQYGVPPSDWCTFGIYNAKCH